MTQCYVRLRGALFAEDGYCLTVAEIAPNGIKTKDNVFLSTLDANGKTIRIEKMHGTVGDCDPLINIPLHPYLSAERGRQAVLALCSQLEGAKAGWKQSRAQFAGALAFLMVHGIGIDKLRGKAQMDAVCAWYGKARVADELNRHGTVAGLGKLDPVPLVAEALA